MKINTRQSARAHRLHSMQPQLISLTPWQDLSPCDRASVLALNVTDQQIEFAGTVEHAVKNCEANAQNDVVGLAIKLNEEVVGFLVLKRRATAPDWVSQSAAVVSAMRVDTMHQGKGFGSAALLALSDWLSVNWPESLTLCLSVDEENFAGIRAYTKAGFLDQGVREQGRIGWVRYMSKSAEAAQARKNSNPTIERTC